MSYLIECQNVSHAYGRQSVLREVNLSLESGAPIALIGENGAGKTTLISLLCGFETLRSGKISLLGQAAGSPALRGRVGVLPQDAELDYRLSIGKQLSYLAQYHGFSAKQARHEAQRVLERVSLSSRFNSSPADLSHGMKKRVSIAQALIGQPELVILDEPTAGLDPVNTLQIKSIIREMADQCNFLISSHNVIELESLCDRLIYLEDGVATSQNIQHDNQQDYMTLVVAAEHMAEAQAELAQHEAVASVDVSLEQELLIKLQPASCRATFAGYLATRAIEKNWGLRSLFPGLSLTTRLYHSPA